MKQKLFSLVVGKDITIEHFSGTGSGGQHRNKKQNCVRLKHLASGTVVVSQNERSRKQNERIALQRLAKDPKFLSWVRVQAAMMDQGYKDIEDKIDQMLQDPKQLKIEYL